VEEKNGGEKTFWGGVKGRIKLGTRMPGGEMTKVIFLPHHEKRGRARRTNKAEEKKRLESGGGHVGEEE